MKQRLSKYIYIINVCGILLCVGLFICNMAETKKLSEQYNRLQQDFQQVMEQNETSVQNKNQNEIQSYAVEFYSEPSIETVADESGNYGLEKYSYLVNEGVTLSEEETDTAGKN